MWSRERRCGRSRSPTHAPQGFFPGTRGNSGCPREGPRLAQASCRAEVTVALTSAPLSSLLLPAAPPPPWLGRTGDVGHHCHHPGPLLCHRDLCCGWPGVAGRVYASLRAVLCEVLHHRRHCAGCGCPRRPASCCHHLLGLLCQGNHEAYSWFHPTVSDKGVGCGWRGAERQATQGPCVTLGVWESQAGVGSHVPAGELRERSRDISGLESARSFGLAATQPSANRGPQ